MRLRSVPALGVGCEVTVSAGVGGQASACTPSRYLAVIQILTRTKTPVAGLARGVQCNQTWGHPYLRRAMVGAPTLNLVLLDPQQQHYWSWLRLLVRLGLVEAPRTHVHMRMHAPMTWMCECNVMSTVLLTCEMATRMSAFMGVRMHGDTAGLRHEALTGCMHVWAMIAGGSSHPIFHFGPCMWVSNLCLACFRHSC